MYPTLNLGRKIRIEVLLSLLKKRIFISGLNFPPFFILSTIHEGYLSSQPPGFISIRHNCTLLGFDDPLLQSLYSQKH